MGILAWTTLLPILGAVLVALVPKEEESIQRGIGFLVVAGHLPGLAADPGRTSTPPRPASSWR